MGATLDRLRLMVIAARFSSELLFLPVLPLQAYLTLSLPPGTTAFLPTDFLNAWLALGFAALGKLLEAFTQLPAGDEAVHLA